VVNTTLIFLTSVIRAPSLIETPNIQLILPDINPRQTCQSLNWSKCINQDNFINYFARHGTVPPGGFTGKSIHYLATVQTLQIHFGDRKQKAPSGFAERGVRILN